MRHLDIAFQYILHQVKAYSRYSVHSPFVYSFLEKVLYNDFRNSDLNQLYQLRKTLIQDSRYIRIVDLGAGSRINPSNKRLIKDIAKNSSKASKYGRLFYRMVQYFKPNNVLELGTSLGLSTGYFAKARSRTQVYTLEGCPETQKIAIENFRRLQVTNVHPILGNFADSLPNTLKMLDKVDFVFFDGNHQEKPTLQYFESCLNHIHEGSIFVFDDIHWSDGMIRAWEKIKNHPKTRVTLDLFFLGIVFFDSRLSKQDFKIRF